MTVDAYHTRKIAGVINQTGLKTPGRPGSLRPNDLRLGTPERFKVRSKRTIQKTNNHKNEKRIQV